MRNFAAAASVGFLLSASALAAVQPFPANFGTENVITNGTQIYVRVGGAGPAVLLLHGYGETGDMWAPLAAQLARDHIVIVPDLRGLGLSSRPSGGYDKRPKRKTLLACSIRSRSIKSILSPMISATWSAMRLPPSIPSG
jgi:pimeloyl-ACP methyl ester carboxylesterase